MAIDENNASYDDQRDIKEVCRQIKNKRGIQFDELFDQMNLGVGMFYESTLGRGGAKAAKVYAIYQWIIANEIELASKAKPHLFQTSMQTGWQAFLDERGVYDHLFTKPFAMGQLHDLSDLHPLNPKPIKIGQQFTFDVESAIDGSVVALDHYKNKWYPIPLDLSASLAPIPIRAGSHGFPIRNGDLTQITPMRQKQFDGEHGHCFLVGPDQLLSYYTNRFSLKQSIEPKTLDEMAKRFTQLERSKIAILLENVLFQ